MKPQPTLRGMAWWCMREMGEFSLKDLMATIAVQDLQGVRSNLMAYLNALTARGVIRPGRTDHWRLVRDLGPKHPTRLLALGGEYFDMNTGKPLPVIEDNQ